MVKAAPAEGVPANEMFQGIFSGNGFAGYLDLNGQATATLEWPGNGNASLIGKTFVHAAFTLESVDAASNPVPLTFE